MVDTTLRTLTTGASISDGDLFISRQGADAEDKSVTGTQIKAFVLESPAITGTATITTAQAATSAGITFKTNSGSDNLHLANGGSPNATAYGGWNFDAATANKMAYFGASKTLSSATNAEIENGFIRLPNSSTPTTPASDGCVIFGRSIGGRSMPAFIGPSGLDSALQPLIGRNNVRLWQANGNANSLTVFGATALTATGTATAYNFATGSLYSKQRRVEYLATSALQAVAGFRHAVAQFSLETGFTFICRFAPATGLTSSHTMFVGCTNSTSAPLNGADPGGAYSNMFGVGYHTADTNLQIIHRGAAAATKVDLGSDFPKPTSDRGRVYEVVLFSAPGSGVVNYEVRDLTNDLTTTGTITTNLPSNTTALTIRGHTGAGNNVTAAIGFSFTSAYLETDY